MSDIFIQLIPLMQAIDSGFVVCFRSLVSSQLVVQCTINWLLFSYQKNPGGSKIVKKLQSLFGTLLWPVAIDETIVQQNRIKSLHHNGNPLQWKRRRSKIIVVAVIVAVRCLMLNKDFQLW